MRVHYNHINKIRIINTKEIRYNCYKKNTIFGFMAINGNDIAMVSDKAKKEDMITFLELIRENNPYKSISIILDNAKIHRARDVINKAKELDIKLIYLPPYSPDLNPIEFSWKDIKRELARILDYDTMVEKSKDIAISIFNVRKYSYSKYWIERFL